MADYLTEIFMGVIINHQFVYNCADQRIGSCFTIIKRYNDGTFFVPVCSLCLKLNIISLCILYFFEFFMFHIIFAIILNYF